MKKIAYACILPTLVACSSMTEPGADDFYSISHQEKGEIDSFDLPRHAINDLVKGLTFQMLDSSNYVTPKNPIAVASFVNLKDLESTNWLGNQLAESFVHELQRHGMIVVDYKTTGHIRVTKEGDYAFSRDWKELPERQIIDYVVTGTMMEQEDGIMVNARMIGMQSRVVVASAQSFVPKWVLGDVLTVVETHYQHDSDTIKMKDGMIIRDAEQMVEDERAVELQN